MLHNETMMMNTELKINFGVLLMALVKKINLATPGWGLRVLVGYES